MTLLNHHNIDETKNNFSDFFTLIDKDDRIQNVKINKEQYE